MYGYFTTIFILLSCHSCNTAARNHNNSREENNREITSSNVDTTITKPIYIEAVFVNKRAIAKRAITEASGREGSPTGRNIRIKERKVIKSAGGENRTVAKNLDVQDATVTEMTDISKPRNTETSLEGVKIGANNTEEITAVEATNGIDDRRNAEVTDGKQRADIKEVDNEKERTVSFSGNERTVTISDSEYNVSESIHGNEDSKSITNSTDEKRKHQETYANIFKEKMEIETKKIHKDATTEESPMTRKKKTEPNKALYRLENSEAWKTIDKERSVHSTKAAGILDRSTMISAYTISFTSLYVITNVFCL